MQDYNSLPLITVAIPVYNCEKFIENTVASVLKQSYLNIEIILVDDKGQDNSSEIIKNIQKKHPNKIRIIEHEKNSGSSLARNNSIDDARGEFIFFIDGDDKISEDAIESHYKKIIKTSASISVGKMMAINSFNNTEYEIFPLKNSTEFIKGQDNILFNFCNGAWNVSACNKLCRVDFLRKNNLYFEVGIYSQDELWSFHVASKLDNICFVDEFTYFYFLHGESVIFNKGKKNFENHQTIIEYFTKAYHEEEKKSRKKAILKHIIQFKETTLAMQWKFMKNDSEYWKRNYSRLKKAPSLSLVNYFSKYFSKDIKKKNFFQNLPTYLGYRLFKWRFERS